MIEIYGLQEQGYSIVKRLERQSTVQRTKPIQKGGSSKTLIVYDPSFESVGQNSLKSIGQDEIIWIGQCLMQILLDVSYYLLLL